MKVLLAIDGSGHSDAAVDEMVHKHLPVNSEIRVISVVGTPYIPGSVGAEYVDMRIYDEIENAAKVAAHAAVDKAVATLRAADGSRQRNITTTVVSGSPQQKILEEAEAFGADLIIVGSHGHGKFEQFLLGSVAHAVALHAKCSVEIVRSRQAPANKSKAP